MPQSKLLLLSTCLAITFLFGCGSMTYPDVNVDPAKNNKATFQQDAIVCARSYPSSDSGAHFKERISCMNLKGWR
ncbi:hypothetical protein C2759_01530 [Polynucleobacter sp. MG-Unter2-18]|uniref:hypothetical protein n=1 Tax=Polynucleobacter sp. MG-Unter2-18 TaxID=2081052 RepID=UPI001BFD4534|nr:hypothetical protein [Polynucleobacter sp. MG-Unter2-18]QWD94846.1 hypothetical protein C2759_01530 [Polynucleobacter sp. MG-Unter2-18]